MKLALACLLIVPASLTMLPAHAAAGPRLPEYMCQPLSGANLEKCCDAANWRDIIMLESQDRCADRGTLRLRNVAINVPGEESEIPQEPGVNMWGNPGNDKPVGRSGEKDVPGMRNTVDTVGVRGMSDNPAKGGQNP